MTYKRLKKLILAKRYNSEDIKNMLDVFLMSKRITTDQYNELMGMLDKA